MLGRRIARAAKIIARENPELTIIAHRECDGVTVDGEMPADHAGLWETSMFMSMYPELAHMELLRDPPLEQKRYFNAPNDYYHESAKWEWSNDVWGASKERGLRAIGIIVEHMAREVWEALDQ